MNEVGGPLVGDGGAAEDDDRKRHRRPEADHVVPVEVAGPPPEAAAKPERLPPGGAATPRRPPEVDPADEQEQEPEVGGRHDRPADDAVLALERQPPVEVHDAAQEAPRSRVAVARRFAGEAVDVDGGSVAEPEHRGLPRIPVQGHGRDEAGRRFAAHARDQLVEREGGGVRGGVGAIAAKRPPVELRLVGEEDAGRRHQEDGAGAGDADRQVEPEDRPAQGHVRSRLGAAGRRRGRRPAPRRGAGRRGSRVSRCPGRQSSPADRRLVDPRGGRAVCGRTPGSGGRRQQGQ